MAELTFSPGPIIRKGWEFTRNNIIVMLGLLLLEIVIYVILSLIGGSDTYSVRYILISLISALVLQYYSLAFYKITLDITDGGEAGFSVFSKVKRLFIPYFFTNVVVGIIVLAGLVIFIIPGVYLWVRLAYAPMFVITNGANPLDAIQQSWSLTSGFFWPVLGLGLLLLLLNVLGVIALVVGFFITSIITMFAYTISFRTLEQLQNQSFFQAGPSTGNAGTEN